MSHKFRDARAALRLIRERCGRVNDPLFQMAVSAQLDTVARALDDVEQAPIAAIVTETPCTRTELEEAVIRCALEERRLRLQLQGAPKRAQLREGLQSSIALDAAVEALAEHETRRQLEQVRANATSEDRAS